VVRTTSYTNMRETQEELQVPVHQTSTWLLDCCHLEPYRNQLAWGLVDSSLDFFAKLQLVSWLATIAFLRCQHKEEVDLSLFFHALHKTIYNKKRLVVSLN